MKAVIIGLIVADVFVMLVVVDLIIHEKDNKRRAYILRMKKAAKEMLDNYGGYDEIEPKHALVKKVAPQIEEPEEDLEEWIAGLTKNERDLHDFYSGATDTIKIPLFEEEAKS
jgi:hypothetical protein